MALPYFNLISHYVLLIPKRIAFSVIHSWNTFKIKWNNQIDVDDGFPSRAFIEGCRDELIKILNTPEHSTWTNRGRVIKMESEDHQALRQGSLCWALPREEYLEGLNNFFDSTGSFKRGVNTWSAVPAMPISVAFGITAGICKAGNTPKDRLRNGFIYSVVQLVKNSFELSNCSSKPRAMSTGFDAVYSLSILYTARTLGWMGAQEYIDKIWKYFSVLIPIPVVPIPFSSDRKFFVDHIAMIAAWTCVHHETEYERLAVLRKSVRSIFELSRYHANPYMAALANECGVVLGSERDYVLKAHAFVDPVEAATIRDFKSVPGVLPIDWTHVKDREFSLDQCPKSVQVSFGEETAKVPLSGLTLCESLLVLSGVRAI